MRISRKKKRVLVVTACLLVLAAIIGFSVNARRTDQIGVQMEKVDSRDKLIAKVSSTGEIRPKNYVELQSEIAGVVTDVYVKEGDVVQKGDLLLRIDPIQTETESRAQQSQLDIARTDALNQLSQITLQETNLERDRANLRVAEAELHRAERMLQIAHSSFARKQELFEQNLISRDLYDQAKNELITAETAEKTATAHLEQAKAQMEVTKVVVQQAKNSYVSAQHRIAQNVAMVNRTQDLLTKTIIRSPLEGVITKLNVEKGERAVPGTLNNPLPRP
jgi:HlyD family secretion protein